MRNPAHRPIENSASRLLLAMLVAPLLGATVEAQYVNTIITNLSQPSGVATDSNNNVYITDSGNNRIVKYVPTTGVLTTLAGSGNYGTNNGTGTAASFFLPQGIVAAGGVLYVVDEGSQLVRKVTFGGAVTTLAGQPYIVGESNGPAAAATFNYPTGIAADSQGNLYVADTYNNAIRKIDTNNMVSTVSTGSYSFNSPSAVAVDNNSNLWVADTGNQVICMISSNGAVTNVAGTFGLSGTNDSLVAASAQFKNPSGLLWVSADNSFLISDTLNNTIRSLYPTGGGGSAAYAVTTVAGIPGQSGLVNGAPAIAEFSGPVGLAVDSTDIGFYIVDSVNDALRVFQPTAPQPPVPAPTLGFINFVPNSAGTLVSQFTASSNADFNNATLIGIQAEFGTQTYITFGPTPASLFSNTIAQPGPGSGSTPPIYPGDGTPYTSQTWQSIVPVMPDMTIYAISTAAGRQSSPIVGARYQYITASPTINGDNAADLQVTDLTQNAQMYYTLDGSMPTNDGSDGIEIISQPLGINLVSNVTFSVRAFRPDFAPSGVASEQLSISNYIGNQMTFGFATGEGSSQFIGAAGERFLAPVTLTMLSGATMYALQFNLSVTNGSGPPITNFSGRFDSMLKVGPPPYPLTQTINPGVVAQSGTNYAISNGVLTNVSESLLEVAWIEVYPQNNLYPSLNQDLTEYSEAHDNVFVEGAGQVIVGAYSFDIPTSAQPGSTYTIQVARPSATTFDPPFTAPIGVFVQAPTNGSLTTGAINSIKTVTVGSRPYLVGDVYPFHWFNAGDFGDTNLLNDDVIETFQSAVYKVNTPPTGSDYFDAMDSSNGSTNNIYDGNDLTINSIQFGDQKLAVDDVYVTLRRSLDPGLTWYRRYWSSGTLYWQTYPNAITQGVGAAPASPASPVKTGLSGPRYLTVAADQIQAGGNLTVQVPIRVLAADPTYPIRVTMLNVEIDPLDGSPAITNAVAFAAVTNLGSPYVAAAQSVNDFAGAWLDSTVPGVSGTNIIGALTVTLPPNVNTNSAYLVHFDHFSASPNGIALFHATVQDGLITVGNRTGSSWNDGIPDTWRLLYFGTVSNALSAADADPDGDGASNWQEYVAGTNPLDAASVFEFSPSTAPAGSYFTLQWPSVVNKNYTIQSSSSINGGWITVASNLIGNSQTLQWTDTNASGGARFYRALVH